MMPPATAARPADCLTLANIDTHKTKISESIAARQADEETLDVDHILRLYKPPLCGTIPA
jgi:hypothetical protein